MNYWLIWVGILILGVGIHAWEVGLCLFLMSLGFIAYVFTRQENEMAKPGKVDLSDWAGMARILMIITPLIGLFLIVIPVLTGYLSNPTGLGVYLQVMGLLGIPIWGLVILNTYHVQDRYALTSFFTFLITLLLIGLLIGDIVTQLSAPDSTSVDVQLDRTLAALTGVSTIGAMALYIPFARQEWQFKRIHRLTTIAYFFTGLELILFIISLEMWAENN